MFLCFSEQLKYNLVVLDLVKEKLLLNFRIIRYLKYVIGSKYIKYNFPNIQRVC